MLRSTQAVYIKYLTSHTIFCRAKCLSYSTPYEALSCKQNKPNRKWLRLKVQTTNFHTTQNLQISPYITLTTCTILPFGSMLFGYCTRHWWLRQTLVQQEKYKRWYWERRSKLFGSLGFLSAIFFVYYIMHIEIDPVAKRPRFIIFNEHEQNILGEIILSAMTLKLQSSIIPPRDRRYPRLIKIIKQLANANKEIFENTHWTISIVDAPQTNAMVLPSGNVYVFSGIFNVIENDDQLAFILAHEISHVVLLHTMEMFSYQLIKELLFAVPTFLIWACFSKWKALMIYLSSCVLYKLFFLFPYKRHLEIEADEVGFRMAAKSCIDVREVIHFWQLMRKLNDVTELAEIPFLMTHPRHEDREKMLSRMLPEALELRRQANCPELPPRGSGSLLHALIKELEGQFLGKRIII